MVYRNPRLNFLQVHTRLHKELIHKVAYLIIVEFSRSALAVTGQRDNAPMLVKVLLPSPKTLLRESKEITKVPWKVPLEVEKESSLLHVCADFSKDHAWPRGAGDQWPVLLTPF